MTHEPFTGFLQGNITAQELMDTQQEYIISEINKTANPVNPDHYRGFSNNAEAIDITENLTFNAGNAVKYLARAGRIDGQNKGQIEEDLRKALWYTRRELSRLETGERND